MGYKLLGFFLLFPVFCSARPISYPGGWTLMTQNDWEINRVHVHYSPSKNYSIGVASEYYRQDEIKTHNLQWNHLLLRRNTSKSQANIYLKTQGGVALKDSKYEPNIRMHVAGDWETRRYFTSYHVGGLYQGSFDKGSLHQGGRLGIAPYLGEYGELHTWLMIQAEHHPQEEDTSDKFRVTPLIRLFKGSFLAEIGVDDERKVLFNFIYRH